MNSTTKIEKESNAKTTKSKSTESNGRIAIILVRGRIGMKKEVTDTLDMLKLQQKNTCVVVKNTPQFVGMIKRVKDYVTYGNISDEVYNQLVEKRGQEYTGRLTDSKGKIQYKGKYFELNGKKYKSFFRLAPPVKGFGRQGIKKPFKLGGALGDRKTKINDLILNML